MFNGLFTVPSASHPGGYSFLTHIFLTRTAGSIRAEML